jgi:hypothetical protein
MSVYSGYWRVSESSTEIYKCRKEDYCKERNQQYFDPYTGRTELATSEGCRVNSRGPMCEVCMVPYINVNGDCELCTDSGPYIIISEAGQ